jgi:hypothetical protein
VVRTQQARIRVPERVPADDLQQAQPVLQRVG